MSLAIPIDDLLRWSDMTNRRWFDLVRQHPEIMALSCDIRGSSNVSELLQHIVAVELRYAQRLANETESSYDELPFDSVDALQATHERAFEKVRTLLSDEHTA